VRAPLRVALAFATVVGAMVALVVFVFTPRGMGMRQFGEFARVGVGRVSGFASQVDLQSVGMISLSPEVVMEVELTQPSLAREAARRQEQFGEPLYLRGVVLDEYANGRWRASPNPAPSIRRFDADRLAIVDPGQHRDVSQFRVTSLADSREWAPVFHVERMVHVQFETEVDLAFDPRHRILQRRVTEAGSVRYSFAAVEPGPDAQPPAPREPDPGRGELAPPQRDPVDRRGQVTFDESATVLELARAVLRERRLEADPSLRPREDDRLVARALEAYLRANYEYTLDPPRPPRREDATAWFLREGKRGHCEFFASSLAALCRSVGIDARVVAGYLTSEYEPDRSRYVVRAADAHAWVEVSEAPGVWRRYDATPEALPTFRARGRETLLGSVRDWLARVEGFWNSSIVSFDNDAQRRLFAPASRGGMDAGVAAGAPSIRRFLARLDRHTRRAIVLSLVGVALMVAGVVGMVWLRRAAVARRLTRRSAGGWAFDGTDAAARLHARIESILRDAGQEKPESRPLRSHLAALRDAPPGLPTRVLAALDDAACVLYAARFGAQPEARAQLAAAEVRVAVAAREARQSR
jgi:transglutaminase-like putative cysteine protease